MKCGLKSSLASEVVNVTGPRLLLLYLALAFARVCGYTPVANQADPSKGKYDVPEPSDAKSGEAEPSEPESGEAEPSEAKSDVPEPSKAKSGEAEPSEAEFD